MAICLFLALGAGQVVARDEAAGPDAVPADAPIAEIRLIGNRRTQDEIILQELLVAPGMRPTPGLIDHSRQALLDLGLFREVDLLLDPAPGRAEQILTVRVRERHYFLPVPRLDRRQEGDIVYGLQLRFDNLAGLNQRLRVGYRVREYADMDVDEYTASLDYSYPRLLGTVYRVDVALRHSVMPRVTLADLLVNGDDESFYRRESQELVVMGVRWLDPSGRPLGPQFGLGLAWRLEDLEMRSEAPIPQDADGRAVGLLTRVAYTDVHELLFSRVGKSYGYEGEYGDEALGDFGYSRHQFHYRRYHPITRRPHTSLEVNMELGLSHGRLFGRETYGIGGGGTLRGYRRDSFTGEAYFQTNVEVLTPVFGVNALRAATFLDLANTYPTNSRVDPTRLRAGGGLGLRWRIQAFVDTELGLDIAYGDRDSPHVYGYTSATF
ncbi:BamA/TamA family outer membrane protein [Ectothiorhodospiraceae bacterium 2226]|nr:BamA/TamA family outer membrane protein [Ectothiorhodospiraceae bacterium 2226]